MALLIRVDGSVQAVEPADPASGFTLEECYKHLETDMIEVVRLYRGPAEQRGGLIFIIDEEGKLKDKDANHCASIIAIQMEAISIRDLIVGHAILCYSDELR
jgi:hypothetical protein